HVSAYAAAHPWEDWAETWAHYLHMVDLLETAAAYATSLDVPGTAPVRHEAVRDPFGSPPPDFDTMVRQWVPLTLLLNSLNRSLGQQDAYPFALSAGALQKLRFVHDTVAQATG
ncbi:MAG TPA: putative zinc-binding metallopeptidase, partial [Giesbergeria sp.]|nr:putative zinc-binding metallopeptidase [Giesbergeria sp.]